MVNRISSMIWLRTQQLISNMQYLILVVMPYGFAYLYKAFLSEGGGSSEYILFMCLPMLFSISMGNLLTSIIAEEKEKNNLKVLSLSGISGPEYIIGSLFYPILIGISGIILMPLMLGEITLANDYIDYLIISVITAGIIALINLLVAINVNTLNQAQIISLPIMLLTMLLPMLSLMDSTVKTINQYTFMGSFTELFIGESTSLYSKPTFLTLIIWLVVLILLNLWGYRRNLNFKFYAK